MYTNSKLLNPSGSGTGTGTGFGSYPIMESVKEGMSSEKNIENKFYEKEKEGREKIKNSNQNYNLKNIDFLTYKDTSNDPKLTSYLIGANILGLTQNKLKSLNNRKRCVLFKYILFRNYNLKILKIFLSRSSKTQL